MIHDVFSHYIQVFLLAVLTMLALFTVVSGMESRITNSVLAILCGLVISAVGMIVDAKS